MKKIIITIIALIAVLLPTQASAASCLLNYQEITLAQKQLLISTYCIQERKYISTNDIVLVQVMKRNDTQDGPLPETCICVTTPQ